jgi:hypothetical protein|tara:strand:- start:844 stop:987 length:144 start_codon:yes stop_codon:yes gene_type:complete
VPVFFFVMIFVIAMDYTVFLLAPGKEHYERYGNPTDASSVPWPIPSA